MRVGDGLAYAVQTTLTVSPRLRDARLVLGTTFSPADCARVEAALNDEIRRALDQGFSLDEVEAAKTGYLKKRQLNRTSDAQLAAMLVEYEESGRTFAWETDLERRILEIEPNRLLAALRRYVSPEKLTVVIAVPVR